MGSFLKLLHSNNFKENCLIRLKPFADKDDSHRSPIASIWINLTKLRHDYFLTTSFLQIDSPKFVT